MLTEREEKILTLIVEEYIKLTKPVSSNLICKRLKCSSATVRSEMKALEDIGLLEKTHTSSGRVPSEEGYRYYVDELLLGPIQDQGSPIFVRGTKVNSCFERDGILYVDLSKDCTMGDC